MKKCLAIILALVMAFGCMSVAAFAEEDTMTITWDNGFFGYLYARNDYHDCNSMGGITVNYKYNGTEEYPSTGWCQNDIYLSSGDTLTFISSVGKISKIEFSLNFSSSDTIFNDCTSSYDSCVWNGTAADTVVLTSPNGGDIEVSSVVFTVIKKPVFEIDSNGVLTHYNGNGGDVIIPDGVTSISQDAFYRNKAITSVTIPSSTTYIADFAFFQCSNLADVTLSWTDADDIPKANASAFAATNATLHIPGGMTDAYVAKGWNKYFTTIDDPAPSTFLTSFTLNKDYDDKYSTGNKTTAVNETVTYTIAPISTGDDVPEFTNNTFTIDVDDGVGSAEVPLPETITKAGDYWYSITETDGKTAGVTYDTNTYYLHLVTDCKGDEFGILSAQVHKTAPGSDGTYTNEASDKITGFTNSYAEGTLKICQETLIDGSHNDYDEFEATVTFTLPEGKEITGSITYGDNQTVTFDDNGVGTAVITLKDGESITFEHIPDGVTYTVAQTNSNEDLGFELDSIAFDSADTGDKVENNIASGTIGDAEDVLTISNVMETATDVGVIVEYTAFVLLALAAVAAGAWLVISRRRKAIDAE